MNEKLIRRIVTWVLIAGAVVIVGGLSFALWLSFSDGPPPDVSDLAPARVPIPDSENGFLMLGGLGTVAKWDPDVPKYGWTKPKKWDQGKVDAMLLRNEPALALLDKALELPGFQFEKIESTNQSFPYLTPMLDVGSIDALAAFMRWKRGEQHAAMEETLKLLEFGRRIENGDGVLIHYLVGISMQMKALDNFTKFAATASSTQEADLRRAIARMEDYEEHAKAFCAAARKEYAGTERIIDEIATGKMNARNFTQYWDSSTGFTLLQPNNTKMLFAEAMRQSIREAALPYAGIDKEPGMLKSLNNMSRTDLLLSSNNLGRLLFMHSAEVQVSTGCKRYSVATKVRLTRALLAVRCYWLDHGVMPTSLDDLVPGYLDAVPVDPYDGKPLRYSPATKVIYSVGKDLRDKGGDMSDGNTERDRQPTVKIEW